MPPTLREAAEELMLAIKETGRLFDQSSDEYIDKGGWLNQHWQGGFKMLREAIAAHDAAELAKLTGAGAAALIDSAIIEAAGNNPKGLIIYNRAYEGRPPRTKLPPLRWTERRDPCSADARGEWTDFD